MTSISTLLQDIALDHTNTGLSGPPRYGDHIARSFHSKPRKKKTTREKIESMVTEGTKNYPAYLKLIYTGESDFSSEDEMGSVERNGKKTESRLAGNVNSCNYDNDNNMETVAIGDQCDEYSVGAVELANGEPNTGVPSDKVTSNTERFKLTSAGSMCRANGDYRVGMRHSKSEDSFYDTIETSSPEYDHNATNTPQGAALDPEEDEIKRQEYQKELAKLEEEIFTLRTVLGAKVYQATELKRKLGITPMTELKSDVKQGFTNIKQSDAYQKTGSAFKSFGAFASRKFGDMRNSNTFKSFEDKMGGAYSNVKTKMSGSQSENNFHETLDSPSEPTIVENPSAGAVATSEKKE